MRKVKGLFLAAIAGAMLILPSGVQAEENTLSAAEAAKNGEVLEADRVSLESYVTESIKMITGMSDQEIEDTVNPSTILTVPSKKAVESVQSWKDMKKTLGAFKDVKEHKISVSDDSIVIESLCEFENSEGLVTTTLDRTESPFTATVIFSADTDESLGKVMQEAAMNTIMGLGIVFLTLLFLSILIGQFKHIATIENAIRKKKEGVPAAPAAPAAAPAAPVPAAEKETDADAELAAVIAAAVAAYEGTATDGFVVRSIKKRNRNKWQNA